MHVKLVVALCACALVLVTGATASGAAAATPTVTEATGGSGKPVVAGFTAFDLADVGYEESEFFLSGTADAYAITPADGGKFGATVASSAPYTTRIVVVRPIDRTRFNGTVVVEWLNVSGGADASPDWMQGHNQLIREGFAWVGVSAQKVGLEALKGTDPARGDAARYAGLSHPGDDYSYDIYSQAGQVLRDDAKAIFGGLEPKHLIAIGESQSAIRLVTYIDAVHPLTRVYDGFLVHSRAGGAPIRDDTDVPVLVFMTETDVMFSNGTVRQPDSDSYRLWEVPGTAHYDQYGLGIGANDTGDGQGAVELLDAMQQPTNQPTGNFTCGSPINTGPAHFVLDAAFHHLGRWVAEGTPPPKAPRFRTTSEDPFTLATDEHGNTLGGIRTPALDAPVATLTGKPPGGAAFCFLFGTTTPFTEEQVSALYPTHRAFVDAWTRAANSARKAGFLTPADAKELVAAAKQSDVGR